jgi:hypothetical protein
VFCGVFDYGEEKAAVSAGVVSSYLLYCYRLPSSPRLLRHLAEAVAQPVGATCRRRCALKGLDHLATDKGGGALGA